MDCSLKLLIDQYAICKKAGKEIYLSANEQGPVFVTKSLFRNILDSISFSSGTTHGVELLMKKIVKEGDCSPEAVMTLIKINKILNKVHLTEKERNSLQQELKRKIDGETKRLLQGPLENDASAALFCSAFEQGDWDSAYSLMKKGASSSRVKNKERQDVLILCAFGRFLLKTGDDEVLSRFLQEQKSVSQDKDIFLGVIEKKMNQSFRSFIVNNSALVDVCFRICCREEWEPLAGLKNSFASLLSSTYERYC